MKNFVNSIATEGFNVIVKNKADEEYTACKVGSLVARRSRLEEIETNNNKYLIIDETTKERTIPGSGAASNPDTEKYLIRYRKDNPSSQFPRFVRKKWSNVMKIDISNPRNVVGVYVSCEHCNNSIVLVISNIVFQGNNQRPQIMSQKLMNVMKAITGIQFIGKGKIMQQYLILCNLRDIMKTFQRGEKEKTPI